MVRFTSQPRREPGPSPMDSAYVRSTSSTLFRPVMYGGFAFVALTVAISKLFGVDRGLTAVIAGAVGVVGFVILAVRTSGDARRAAEEKRSEFYDHLTSSEEKRPADGQ